MSRPKRIAKEDAIKYIYNEKHIITVDDNLEHLLEDPDTGLNDESTEDPLPTEEDDILDRDVLVNLESDNENEDSEDEFILQPLAERIGYKESSSIAADGDHDNITAPNGRVWTKKAPANSGRQGSHNIMREESGRVKTGVIPSSNSECLFMYIELILSVALVYSNLYGRRLVSDWNSKNPNKKRRWNPITDIEMKAYIGIHLLSAAYNCHYQSTEYMWHLQHGHPVFRATMSENRFKLIKRCFRFDDPLRRNKDDKLAPVRYLFKDFFVRCRNLVSVPEFGTID